MPRKEVTRDKDPKDVAYATLAHYWGSADFLTVTTSNFKNFCQGIEVNLLTQSFQDAIPVTHRLGFQYLWIDSLCIIQDSGEDWMRKSSKMLDVSRFAELTIAAASAWQSSEGLFVDQKPLALSPYLLALDVKGQKKGTKGSVCHAFMPERRRFLGA